MRKPITFDAVVLRSTIVFRTGNRKSDEAAVYSIGRFITCLENGLSLADGQKILADDMLASSFVEETRRKLNSAKAQELAQIAQVNKELLERTHANSEKTLNGQDDMRAEFKAMMEIMRAEFTGMHNQIKATTESGLGLARQNAATAKVITEDVSRIGAVSLDMYGEVKKAVKNTSTMAAVIVGLGVGFFAGIPLGIIANYIYERNLTIEALKKKDSGVVATSGPPLPRAAGKGAAPLPSFELGDPLLAKSLMGLLHDGRLVELPMPNGLPICLKLPKPVFNKGSYDPRKIRGGPLAPASFPHPVPQRYPQKRCVR